MEPYLYELSGAELRKLALIELRRFIDLIENGSALELQKKRELLADIFARLSIKEQEKLQQLICLTSTISPPSLQKSA